MLQDVAERFQGWKVNASDAQVRTICLQVYRIHWQADWTGIHYEACLNVDRLLDGRLDVRGNFRTWCEMLCSSHVARHVECQQPDTLTAPRPQPT